MITFFAVPKAFSGHIGVIQENAIRSWQLLVPGGEILLLGDDPGVDGAAARLGVRHEPQLARNEHGTPLVSDTFARARRLAANERLCYVNCDIVLLGDMTRALADAAGLPGAVLVSGRRWRTHVDGPLDFAPGWDQRLREHVRATAWLDGVSAIDWLVFDRSLFGEIPDFVFGRTRWDPWLLDEACRRGATLVDATEVIVAVHQEHRPGGDAEKSPIFLGPEARRNRKLAGGRGRSLVSAGWKLTDHGLARAAWDRTRLEWRVRIASRRVRRFFRRRRRGVQRRLVVLRDRFSR